MGTPAAPAPAPMELAVVLRPYRGPQDHPAMTEVANAVDLYNGAPAGRSVEGMDTYYAHLEHADLPRDCVIVELDGAVVAYGRASLEVLASGDAKVGAILNIRPDVRGRGIEERLVEHALARGRAIAVDAAAARPTRIQVYAPDRHAELRSAAEAAGFRLIRSGARLVRPTVDDVPDIPMPDGFEVRPIGADDRTMHRRVYDADQRAFADSFDHEAPSDADFQRFIEDPTFDPTLWQVAFHGDEIAGQIINYMDEPAPDGSRIGWTEGISVQREYRRRGLARALLAASIRTVASAGATRAALGVDLHNPNEAATLYQSMGYEIVALDHTYERALDDLEVADAPEEAAGR